LIITQIFKRLYTFSKLNETKNTKISAPL